MTAESASDITDNPLQTRADFQRLALGLYRPVEAILKLQGAAAALGPFRGNAGPVVEALEGYSRQLWALGPLQAGEQAPVVDWGLLREFLVRGTAAGGWGEIQDAGQRMVEPTAIALALVWARPHFWEPLSAREKAQVSRWIGGINRRAVIENNWLCFRVLANAALRELDQPHDAAVEADDLALLYAMWHGDQGYSDGPPEHRNYYVPMAMHHNGLVYATMIRGRDPGLAGLLERRAEDFARTFLAWFANDGAAPPFGRSLQYRFAQ